MVFRNKAAELCEKYLSKGDKIYVEGKIRTRNWQTEDGTTKHTTEIQVTEFTFLTTKKESETNKQFPVADIAKNTNFDPEKNVLPINDLPF